MPSGIEEVYEAGQKAEYDRFWDNNPIAKGATSGENLFSGKSWNDETFKPKYDIIISDLSSCYMMFKACGVTDLVKRLAECGVRLDMSNASTLYYAFFDSKITHIGEISLIRASLYGGTAATAGMFQASAQLHTIDKLIVNEDVVYANTIFTGCTALANITIEGVVGNNVSFADCKSLTHESLMSIINALKDYSNKTMLRFSDTDYTVSGYDTDPRGATFDVHYAEIVDGSLECECSIDGMYGIKITVYDVDISEADLPYISNVEFDVISVDSDDMPIVDVVITVDKTVMSKTLTIGSANIAKLTEAEKKKVTDKGWWLK